MVLKHFGVDPEKEIKAIGLPTDAARLAALKEGIVDAIIVAPPIDYEGKKLGFNVLARAGDIFTFPYNGLGTNIEKNQRAARSGKTSDSRADQSEQLHSQESRRNNPRIDRLDQRRSRSWRRHPTTSSWEFFSHDANIPEDGLRVVIDGFRNSLGITRPIPISEIVDDSVSARGTKGTGRSK